MIYGTKLKELIYSNNHTLTSVNHALNEANHTNKTVQNLSGKIQRESLSYREVLQILEIIGYTCEWKPIDHEISDEICWFDML